MCGLAGILPREDSPPPDPSVVRAMAATVRHRGPDGEGVVRVGRAVLGHRRLAVIDPAGGAQPMLGAGGRVGLVYNGEVYNHRELRSRLAAAGHRFRTRSDTEVVLRAYLEWGASFLSRLNGMFALAIHDARDGTSLLARDRLGVKPLYFAETDAGLVFGSELGAVLASGGIDRTLDPTALLDYLALRYVPAPKTILRAVGKLPAAHALEVRDGRPRLVRFWDLEFAPDRSVPADEWPERVREGLGRAVARATVSDVPIGAFLSGGVDSAAVVSMMAGGAGGPVRTTTAAFRDRDVDESRLAGLVASRLGTDHRRVMVDADPAGALEALSRHYDEPFGDSSAVPTVLLCAAARRRGKVALSGDGGDEVFAGYRRYRYEVLENRIRDRLPGWVRTFAVAPAANVWPKADFLPRPLRWRTLLENVAGSADRAFCRSVGSAAGPSARTLLRDGARELVAGYDPDDRLRALYRDARAGDPLGRAQAVDLATRLPDGMLVKVDRASMAVGLEVRVPFLDHELVELAARIPPEVRMRGGRAKAVLKDALAGTVPEEVLRGRKRGFTPPLSRWLAGPLRPRVEETLLSPGASSADWIEPSRVRALWTAHLGGRRDASDVLWLLLALESWARRFAGTGTAAARAVPA